MAISTISNRDFERNVAAAKRAAKDGPLFITEGGEPAYVLLSIKQYQWLTKPRRTVVDALAMPRAAEIGFEPPRLAIGLHPADFS